MTAARIVQAIFGIGLVLVVAGVVFPSNLIWYGLLIMLMAAIVAGLAKLAQVGAHR